MNEKKRAKPDPPQTLTEAGEALARMRPAQAAPLADWLAYYQQWAALYAEVAEIDRGHHHECLAFMEYGQECAKDIKAEIAAQRPAGDQ